MKASIVSVLSTVNAPHSKQLDGAGLAYCLSHIEAAKAFSGQVGSFFSEIPVADQLSFAAEFGIRPEALKALATEFGDWAGESYRLTA